MQLVVTIPSLGLAITRARCLCQISHLGLYITQSANVNYREFWHKLHAGHTVLYGTLAVVLSGHRPRQHYPLPRSCEQTQQAFTVSPSEMGARSSSSGLGIPASRTGVSGGSCPLFTARIASSVGDGAPTARVGHITPLALAPKPR
jgi:hypothetical protein